jgi:hypothetical protein
LPVSLGARWRVVVTCRRLRRRNEGGHAGLEVADRLLDVGFGEVAAGYQTLSAETDQHRDDRTTRTEFVTHQNAGGTQTTNQNGTASGRTSP